MPVLAEHQRRSSGKTSIIAASACVLVLLAIALLPFGLALSGVTDIPFFGGRLWAGINMRNFPDWMMVGRPAYVTRVYQLGDWWWVWRDSHPLRIVPPPP
jgi:hypothetical protein